MGARRNFRMVVQTPKHNHKDKKAPEMENKWQKGPP